MAVEFSGTNGQGIQFPQSAAINNLVTKSISLWFNAGSNNAGDTYIDKWATGSGWYVINGYSPYTGKLFFAEVRDNTTGAWVINTIQSTSIDYNLIITYNNSSVNNDPIFYLNGTPVAITEAATPVGAVVAETNPLEIGYDSATANSTFVGKIQDNRLYNRILTQADATTLSTPSNRCKYVVPNGLVFWAKMDGATGLSVFDGVALSSANTITDVIGGTEGTPSGSPVGRGVTDKITSAGADDISIGEGVFHRLWLDDAGIHGTTTVDTG